MLRRINFYQGFSYLKNVELKFLKHLFYMLGNKDCS